VLERAGCYRVCTETAGGAADPGDLIQPVDRLDERGDRRLDAGLQCGDVGAGLVDPPKHGLQQEGVMVGEVAMEGLLQQGGLGAQAAPGQLRQGLGSRSPATSAASIARPETPKMSEATTDSLIWASPGSFSTRCFSAVLAATRSAR
jgi:hypothetical protein